MSGDSRILLYGAYGYTGRLAAELAAAKKLDVVLAGRNKDALAGLGDRLSLPIRAVGLGNAEELSAAMTDIACVVHMAGPFAATSAPMLSACLATQTTTSTSQVKLKSSRRRGRDKRRSSVPELPQCQELDLMWFRLTALRLT